MKRLSLLITSLLLISNFLLAQQPEIDKFTQLETLLPTPNNFRTASGRLVMSTGNNALITTLKWNWMRV